MKKLLMSAAVLAASLLAAGAQAAPTVSGDYVESRSANIYVGACHHEGELLTAGRDAVLAWNITDGDYHGVSLNGVRAVAVVAGDKNLSLPDVKRRSVLYISEDATSAQREAVAALLKEKAAGALGEVAGVKTAPISFDASGNTYRVQVAGAAFMKIKKETQELCCKQPYVLWDHPFVHVDAAKAGYCLGVEFKDSGMLQAWSATDQNNAYFGHFAL
jgi:hypothetical protein